MMISAHRGVPCLAPENTVPSILLAVSLGVDFVEFDVRRTRDWDIVLMHDSDVRRTTNGRGIIENLPSEVVFEFDAGCWFSEKYCGTKIPRLYDVLELLRKYRQKIIIDIKSRGIENKILDLLDETDMIDNVVLASHIPEVLYKIRRINSDVPRMLIAENIPEALNIIDLIEPKIIAPTRKHLIEQEQIDIIHELGILLNVGVVDDIIEAKYFSRMKIDILTTNSAHLMVQYLARNKDMPSSRNIFQDKNLHLMRTNY